MKKLLSISMLGVLLTFTINVKAASLKERTPSSRVFYSYLLKPTENSGSGFHWEKFNFLDEIPRYSDQTPATLPFIENFEGTINWTFVNGSDTNKWYVGEAVYAGTSGHSAYISNNYGVSYRYIGNPYDVNFASTVHIYRDIEFSTAAEFALSFDWKCQGESTYDYLMVALVDTSVYPVAHIALTSGTGRTILIPRLNLDSVWSTETVLLSDTLSGKTKRLVFTWINDASVENPPPVAIDNISITGSDCVSPKNLRTTAATPTTIALAWTSTGTSFKIEYREVGSNTWTQETSTTASHTIGTSVPLAPNTTYEIQVQNVCATESSVWSPTVRQKTACLEFEVPFFENFDLSSTGSSSAPNAPNCWSYIRDYSSAYAYVYSTTASYSLPNCYYLYNGSQSVTQKLALVSPSFSNYSLDNVRARFKVKSSSSNAALAVGYFSTVGDTSTFVSVDTVRMPSDNIWRTYAVSFANVAYTGSVAQIVFKHARTSTGQYIYLDDIYIEPIPPCADVESLIAINANESSIDIAYYCSELTSFDVEYREAGSTDDTWSSGGTSNDTVYTVNGLNPETLYEIRVRSLCSGGEGVWSDILRTSTSQVPAVLPFNEDFEGEPALEWKIVNGSQVNRWVIDTAVHYGTGLKTAYVSQDTGRTNNYNLTSPSVVHLYRDIEFSSDAAEYSISFNWKAGGEFVGSTYYDYLRVYLTDVFTTPPVAGTQLSARDTIISALNLSSTWKKKEKFLPAQNLAGKTKRLVFTWINDNGGGTQPAIAIDSIKVASFTCGSPYDITLQSITPNTIQLGWTSYGGVSGSTSYNIQYKKVSESTWQTETVIDTFYVLGSLAPLAPSTEYQFLVQADCGGGDVSRWSDTLRYKTTCAGSIPTYEGFEATATSGPVAPACWSYLRSTTEPMYASTSYAKAGSRSYYMSGYNSSTDNCPILIAPYYEDLSILRVKFNIYYNSTSSPYKLTIGYLTNPTDGSTFHPIKTFNVTNIWAEHVVNLDTVSGIENAHYIAFSAYTESAYNYVYLDDIYIETIPPCADISGLKITDKTPSTTTLKWNAQPGITSYDFQYKKTSDTVWTNVSSPSILNLDSCTLMNLTSATDYLVRARTHCNVQDSGHWTTDYIRFKTPCVAYTLPLYESFETTSTSTPSVPACWFADRVAESMYASSSTPRTGARSYYMASSSTSVNNAPMLISPYFTDLSDVRVKFSLRYSSAGQKLTVGYVLSDGTTFRPIKTYTTTAGVWATYVLNLDTVVGIENARYIGFSANNGTTSNYVYLDDIYIETIPLCADVSGLKVTDKTPTTVTLKWDSQAGITSYDFQYRQVDDTVWTNVSPLSILNLDSCTIINLTSATDYLVRARTHCNAQDTGYWSTDYVSFTTPCVPSTLPIYEGFETTGTSTPSVPACWFANRMAESMYANSSSPKAGGQCYYMGASTSSVDNNPLLISPYFTDLSNARVKFSLRYSSAGQKLTVGYVLSDGITFRPIKTYTTTTAWADYVLNLDTVRGIANARYVAFSANNGSTANYIYLDEVAIEPLLACADMSGTRVTDTTGTTITIKWTAQTGISGYDIQYKRTGYPSWVDVVSPSIITSDSCKIVGLRPGTGYDIRIRTRCNVQDSGNWSYPFLSATTHCDSYTLPFEENFTSAVPPKCWVIKSGLLTDTSVAPVTLTNTTYTWTWQRKNFANVSTAPYSAAVDIYSTTCREWLITPDMDFGNSSQATLEFDLAMTPYSGTARQTKGGVDDKFMVLISTNDQWTIRDTIAVWRNDSLANPERILDSIPNGEGIHVTLPITGVRGVAKIAFYAVSTVSNVDNLLYIGNMRVGGPNCSSVDSLEISAVGNTATATWVKKDQAQDRWEVVCTNVNNESDVIIREAVGEPTYTFTNLTRMATYKISVRALCGSDSSSAVVSLPFTTTRCDTVTNIQLVQECATTASIAWDAPNQNQWQITYNLQGSNNSNGQIVNEALHCRLTDLTPQSVYEFKIRPICGVGDTGYYSTIRLIHTTACEALDTLSAISAVTGDSVFVSWGSNNVDNLLCYEYYDVRIVPAGSAPESVESKKIYTNTGVWISTVGAGPGYSVYVRPYCGSNVYGDWITNLGIDTRDGLSGIKIVLAPNPARDYTKLSIEGATGEVKIQILSITGKLLREDKVKCEKDLNKEVMLQGLAKGTYLVRLVHKDWMKTKKLIVQ